MISIKVTFSRHRCLHNSRYIIFSLCIVMIMSFWMWKKGSSLLAAVEVQAPNVKVGQGKDVLIFNCSSKFQIDIPEIRFELRALHCS